MPDEELRFSCLKIAEHTTDWATESDVLRSAIRFFRWVKYGEVILTKENELVAK